ncbi:MAG: hypothetical protein ABI681_08260 [Gemmatimonadales bacterium]
MKMNKTIAATCLATSVVAGAVAFAARAQTPANAGVVRVVANTTPPADRNRIQPGLIPSPAPSSTTKAATPEVLINRESYTYPGMGRRDPFVSLMNTEELRPLLGDLKLVGIAFDVSGRNSVAVLRDVTTKEQYRVKVGQALGRMRVAAIHQKDVVFGIEEFGYSRQESLAMTDSTKVRMQ